MLIAATLAPAVLQDGEGRFVVRLQQLATTFRIQPRIEPRYNVTKDLQLYVGTSTESISFVNHAAAEVDIYGGVRPTFDAFAFDLGIWGYLYRGGQCQEGFPGGVAVCPPGSPLAQGPNFVQIKQDLSFYEGYGKANWTINDNFASVPTSTTRRAF